MSDLSCAVAFSLPVSPAEAALVNECLPLCEELDFLEYDKDVEAMNKAYGKTSDAFKVAFPLVAGEIDPFTSFRKLFDDPQYPAFGIDLEIEVESDSISHLAITSKRAEVSAIGNLIRVTCPSAHPCGFTFATYASNDDEGSADGGYVAIRDNRVTVQWASNLLTNEMGPNAPFYRAYERHIRHDMTALVKSFALIDDPDHALAQKAKALAAPFIDYEAALKADGWIFVDGAWRGYNWDDFSNWQDADKAGRCESFVSAADACADYDLEPETYSTIEFYAVSEWFAKRLTERKQRVELDFGGIPVWAFIKNELELEDVLEKLIEPV